MDPRVLGTLPCDEQVTVETDQPQYSIIKHGVAARPSTIPYTPPPPCIPAPLSKSAFGKDAGKLPSIDRTKPTDALMRMAASAWSH